MKANRRSFLAGAAAVACGVTNSWPVLGADAFKIGVPTALSGAYGDLGAGIKRAIDMAVDEANSAGGVAGRLVEVSYLDSEMKPDVSRQQAEKLVRQGCSILTGMVSSPESMALGPNLERWGAIAVSAVAKADQLTGENCRRRYFRVNPPDFADSAVVAPWLKARSETKWSFIGDDSVWGRGSAKNFRAAAEPQNKEVVTEDFVPYGTTDFAPYITKMIQAGATGLWVTISATSAVAFTRQASQFKLFEGRVVGGASYMTDAIAATVGKISEGIYGVVNYGATVDTPSNKKFVENFRGRYPGKPITLFDGHAYMAMQVIFQAVAKANSTDPEALTTAMQGGSFDTLKGKSLMRKEDNQLLTPNYFGQIKEVDGNYVNVIALEVPAEAAFPPPDGSCKRA